MSKAIETLQAAQKRAGEGGPKPVRITPPSSQHARYSLFFRLYAPSRRKILEGVIRPAVIDIRTRSISLDR
jgi:hypothetical protein